jgi:hypothetical protein
MSVWASGDLMDILSLTCKGQYKRRHKAVGPWCKHTGWEEATEPLEQCGGLCIKDPEMPDKL